MALAPQETLIGAPGCDGTIQGSFCHTDTGVRFDYSIAPDQPPYNEDYCYAVWLSDGTYRWANVRKTVAYVIVDEDVNCVGRPYPVIERWPIKRHYLAPNRWQLRTFTYS